MAQDDEGAYVGFRIGLANTNDVDVVYGDSGGTFGGTGATDTAEFTADVDSALAFGGVAGYDFGVVRADLEVDYSRNKVSGLTINRVNGQTVTLTPDDAAEICDFLETDNCSVSGNTIATEGRLRQLSAMANLWVDLPIGGSVTPYAGGGLGLTGYEIDGEGDARFSWQIGAGVAVNVSSTVVLSADLRHRRASGVVITDEEFPDFSTEIGNVSTTTISAGLRFRF
jgi:opacity protein-like surface antigen